MRWARVAKEYGVRGHSETTTIIVHARCTTEKAAPPSAYKTRVRTRRADSIGNRWVSLKIGPVSAAGTYQYPNELRISNRQTSTSIGSLMLIVLSR